MDQAEMIIFLANDCQQPKKTLFSLLLPYFVAWILLRMELITAAYNRLRQF